MTTESKPVTGVNVRGTELSASDTSERCREKIARITLDSMVQFVGLLDAKGTVLEIAGHEVVLAHDGFEAIARAAQFRPEVIFMDVGMPGLNGLDATRRIRQEPWGKAATIIALTGWGQECDREQSREAGCNGHLVKPVAVGVLHQILGAPPQNG